MKSHPNVIHARAVAESWLVSNGLPASKAEYLKNVLLRERDEIESATVAAIVAWLREDAKRFGGRQTVAADEHPDETTLETLLYAADAIERGDYRRGKP